MAEYTTMLIPDHSDDSVVIIPNDYNEINDTLKGILDDTLFPDFHTLQAVPPNNMETETPMSVIESLPNHDLIDSSDVHQKFIIFDQDFIEFPISQVNETFEITTSSDMIDLINMGTTKVDNGTAFISLASVDNPSSVDEPLSQIIPEMQTTMNQQVVESVPEIVQCTVNQVMEGAARDKQNATNNEEKGTKYEPRTPKKRGRKPKLPGGRRSRPQKVKLYEMNAFEDSEKERRRLNAVNAMRHRKLAKDRLTKLEEMLQKVTEERDMLKNEVEKLKKSEDSLLKQLGDYKVVIVN
ncbi:hypothetical protein Pcinc_030310 [Petrolisthes cinctipes]|uniref:BZIP domain-containing protein n=1 Tax=Petrolisthes cinctipes TaxID=88211 RepID=A0AAE1EZI6_PETCI|nr:hypothetical protein Pcinc_030310 [Petrolisthes cinctipes]